MQYKQWFIYFACYALITIPALIFDSSTDYVNASDVNNAVGFQVDKFSSGAGFFGLLRNVIDFFTVLLPKLFFFNYSFLQGELQLLQWVLILVFGGTAIAMLVAQRVLGVGR